MDGSLPGSMVHGIFQARILEWAAISFSKNVITGLKNTLELEVFNSRLDEEEPTNKKVELTQAKGRKKKIA